MAVEWDLKGGGWDESKIDLDGGLDGGLEKRNVQKFFSLKKKKDPEAGWSRDPSCCCVLVGVIGEPRTARDGDTGGSTLRGRATSAMRWGRG